MLFGLILRIRTLPVAPPTVAVAYIVAARSTNSVSIQVHQYVGRAILAPNYTLRGTRFRIGNDIYVGQTDGSVSRNPDPATGAGSPAGAISASLGGLASTAWTTNA